MTANRRLTGFSPAVREIIRARASRTHTYGHGAGAVCEALAYCQGAAAEQHHHRRPRAAGGSRRADTNLASNAIFVCRNCHDFIERNRVMARENGWLISNFSSRSPAEIPCMYRGKWSLLSDAGDLVYIPAPATGKAS